MYGKLPYNATMPQGLARPDARKRPACRRLSLSKARLDALVEEATTDAYNEGEQIVGFLTLIDDSLATPFETNVLGVNVTVERVDLTEGDGIVATCRRAGKTQKPSRLPREPSGSRLIATGGRGVAATGMRISSRAPRVER